MSIARDQIPQLCADVLSKANSRGASAAEVYYNDDLGFSVSTRLGEVENLEHHQDSGLTLNVYIGHQTASVSTSDLSPGAVDEAITKAVTIAKHTGADDCNGVADKVDLATDIPDLDLYHPWDTTPEKCIAMAVAAENAGMACDPRITNSEGVSIDTMSRYRYFANSLGFGAGYSTSYHSMNCILIAEHNKQKQRDYDYTVARDANDLFDFSEVARRAAKKTLDRLNARPIKTCKVPVLFNADLAKGLIGCLIRGIYGSSQYRKSSFLLDHIGKRVISDHISIHQQPHLKKGNGSCPFDDEGVTTRSMHYVHAGQLESYVLSSYSARKLGLKTTGNSGGVYNISVDTTQRQSVDQMLKDMGTGFLVTELIGQGVNLVTGDYSRGAVGFWIENGIIQHAVEGVTIAGNLTDMLQNIVSVGDDIDKRSNIQVGSVLVSEMTVAGN